MRIRVDILSGARAGATFVFEQQPTVSIGRRPENQVQLDVHRDLDVSGQHAELRMEADGLYLYDKNSANGTFTNGARITRLKIVGAVDVMLGANGPTLRIQVEGVEQPVNAVAAPPSAVATEPPAVAPGVVAPAAMPHGPAPQAMPQAAPAPAAAAPTEPQARLQAGQKVGARTVAMMIDQAMAQTRDQPKRGKVGRSTVFLRSMVDQAVTTSTRRFKVVIALMAVVLVGAVAGLLVLRQIEKKRSDSGQQELRKQMAALMTALNQGDDGVGDDKRSAMKKRLSALKTQLAQKAPVAPGRAIVRSSRDAVFLLAADLPTGQAKGFCTAFAIKKRMLATNAHCVVALEKFRSSGMRGYLVLNRNPGRRYRIKRAIRHPRYRKPVRSITEDVGLLIVTRDLPVTVPLAKESRLRALESGDVMYTYGFPGRLARVSSPNATLVQGIIGRLTRLNGNHGSFRTNKLIQHSAFTSGGTSGSPIFDATGHVIAVNAGSYVEAGTLRVLDPLTGRQKKLRVAKQLAGYNFGIRVDVLRDLMRRY